VYHIYFNVISTYTGLGDSGYGWFDAAEEWQSDHPHVKFILPNAPIGPVTLNGGMDMPCWHDIHDLTKIDCENYKGLDESIKIVDSLINDEIQKGTPSNRIIVGGFSQGAALAAVTTFQSKFNIAGVICLSGYLPFSGDFTKAVQSSANANTPVFVGHGTHDRVVAPKAGANLASSLTNAGVQVTNKLYQNMDHSTCPQEVEDVSAFISARLPFK
jgi:predicted esterase